MLRCLQVLSLIIIAGFTFQRCTFEPDNQFINPIPPPEPLTVTVEVNDPNFKSPYYIVEPTTFIFTLKDLTKPMVDYVISIDGDDFASGAEAPIYFSLTPYHIPSGSHKVTMRVRAKTNSGSLAEQLDAEYYVIEKSFTLINDRTIPSSLNPTVAYENGRLAISWSAIPQKNFYYVIKRTYSPYNPLPDTIIRNTELSTFIDNGYTGGDITYTIAVSGSGFERVDLGTVTFKDDPVDFQVVEGEEKSVRLIWNNSKIDTQNIELAIDTDGQTIKVPLTSSGNMVIDTLVLGEERNYWIKTSEVGNWRQVYSRMKGVKYPSQIKPFKSHALLVDQNRLLLLTSNAIYEYALPSLILEDSLLAQSDHKFSGFAITDDGNRAVLTTEKGRLFEFNPLDFDAPLSELGLFAATVPYTGGTDPIYDVVLGDLSRNGLLSMVIGKYGSRTQVVYDINNSAVPWYAAPFRYLNEVHPPSISSDGRYLASDYPGSSQGEVYQWNGAAFDQIGRVATGPKFFRPGNREIISGTWKDDDYQISPGSVRIYDLNTLPADPMQTLPLLRSMEFANLVGDSYFWSIGYDQRTDIFYTRYVENVYSTLTLYDANTMALLDKVSAFTYSPSVHFFESNYQITDRGSMEYVK